MIGVSVAQARRRLIISALQVLHAAVRHGWEDLWPVLLARRAEPNAPSSMERPSAIAFKAARVSAARAPRAVSERSQGPALVAELRQEAHDARCASSGSIGSRALMSSDGVQGKRRGAGATVVGARNDARA